jgi:hypothetical protein
MVRRKWFIAGLLASTILVTSLAPAIYARGRGGPKFRAAVRSGPVFFSYGGYRRYAPYRSGYYGFGHNYGGHHYHGTPGGRVDFNVHPKESQVFVDGAYIGVADDYNGGFFGTTAVLTPGTHNVRIVAPDGREKSAKIYVMPGRELNFNFRF